MLPARFPLSPVSHTPLPSVSLSHPLSSAINQPFFPLKRVCTNDAPNPRKLSQRSAPAAPLTQPRSQLLPPSGSAALGKVRNNGIPGALHHCWARGGRGQAGGRKGGTEAEPLSALPGEGEQREGRRCPVPISFPGTARAARRGRGGGEGGCDGGCCSNLIESICQFTTRITSGAVLSFCCRVSFLFFF